MDPLNHTGAIVAINLSIKGVSEQVAERLRVRAERHHRSLQGELMAIVERAAAEDGPDAGTALAVPPGPLATAPAHVLRQGWRSIADLVADQHERRSSAAHAPPPEGLPLAVDILRADRDSR